MFTSYYMQVLSLGVVWTFFHCAGMCGPLVAGLTSRVDDSPSRWRRLALRARRVLAYQAGRAITYALLGAAVGLLGAVFQDSVKSVAAISGFVVAPAVALVGVTKLVGWSPRFGAGEKIGGLVRGAMRLVRPLGKRDWVSSLLTGVVLGLLPCGLMFWVMSVAATTASPLHGAGVMVTLVLLTTPTLLFAGCVASAWRFRWSERAVGIVLLISAAWMLHVAIAANEVTGPETSCAGCSSSQEKF